MHSLFGARLQKWYKSNKRDLPWRHSTDPYKIWLSEVILQQTQVVQGLSYYMKFVDTYPTVKQLAKAKEDDVLKLWQGLGYYSRARNLHETAKTVASYYKGIFPQTYDELLKLKGIGVYTAAAIASFSFGKPHAVVDGNVYRVLSRVFGIKTAINSPEGKKQFQELANELLDKKHPAQYNQAIMEFGSQYCKPANPNCDACVLNTLCYAFSKNKVGVLPVKLNKTKIKDRYLNYFLIQDKNERVLVHQRTQKDIWKGLYELFLIETKEEAELKELLKNKSLKAILKKEFIIDKGVKKYKHILSHQHLYASFYVITCKGQFDKKTSSIPCTRLGELAWPRLIDKFLNICKLH